ncbi:MAG: transcription antitermination factor NusB, partial [Planctomycetota bacterium]
RGLDERDTGLCRKLVGLEVRRRATLRAIVAGFAHRQPKRDLALMLRLGIAQILWLDRVPRHAAVSETVGATSELVGLSKGSVVNGVLRNLIRALKPDHSGDPTVDVPGAPFHFDAPVFRDPAEHPHLWAEDALSVPSALHKKWTQRAGMDEANRLARMAYDEAPLSLRARDAAERDERLEELRALGVDAVPGAHPALILCPAESAGVAIRSEAFAAGALTAQGEHAARAVELVGDVSGARVLDVCAAPGGKTTYLLQRGAAGVVSVDASAGRLARLEAGLARVGLGGRGRAAAMDATAALRPDARFDAVLVDAPCSNTGVLAQRPAARWRYGPKSQSALVAIQERLLESAAERVAPGGALVYSTCSLEPEENEQRVARFLERSGEFVEESRVRSAPRPPAEGGPVDGGFAARLVRTSG